MDPRAGLPFSRPQSQQTLRDPRFTSIPISQYASQPNTPRPDTLHKNDPFLRRRNDLDDPRRSPSLAQGPRQYGLPTTSHYPSNHITALHDTTPSNSHLRRSSQSSGALFGAGRMDRFGSQSSEGADVRELIHPAQQASGLLSTAPTSSFIVAQQTRNAQESHHSQSNNQAASPRVLRGVEHPPPPPPFNGRQMLPPSPQVSQAHHNLQATFSRGPSTSVQFPMSRDLPTLSASVTHRPTSSMSISSMLDSDTVKPSREAGPINHGNGTSSATGNFLASPTRQSTNVASPSRVSQGSIIFPETSSSPEKYKVYYSQNSRPHRSYSSGLEQRPPFHVPSGSPEGAINGSFQGAQSSPYTLNSVSGAQTDLTHQTSRQANKIGRPSSQPSDFSTPREFDGRLQLGDAERMRQQQMARKHYIELEESNRENPMRQSNGESINPQGHPQQRTQQPQDIRATQSGAHRTPKQERLNGSTQTAPSRAMPNPENMNIRFRSETGRPLERENRPSHVVQSPYSPESLRRLREERQVLHQQSTRQSPVNHLPRTINHIEDRQPPKYPGPPVKFADSTEAPIVIEAAEQQQAREDIAANNRSALAQLIESSKRGGRFSPLPQAVQGAQGRTSGPASDPGIKNEFARMFSGIGSGVGSAGPAGSGTNTPFTPPSPTMSHEPQRRTPFGNRVDLAVGAKSRTASKGSRKPRRAREDEPRAEPEDGERSTPVATTSRVAKRSRGGHHHHPYHVHLGHRHHNLDDVETGNENRTPSIVNGRRVNTPTQAGAGSHRHRGHHHGVHHAGTHHHHHHHQEAKPIRIPTTIIKNDAVFESVRLRPRQHLGSVMYCSILEPSSRSASSGAKYGYLSSPCPMPRYDGKENCTYTVRIPKFYLEAQEREEICRRRALWGTDIYTDDSDVLAAAMHSGWVRSEFGEEIDPSMLAVPKALKGKETEKTPLVSQDVFDSPPDEPMTPPRGKELRLTLVVLPALESYASHVAHGIKSRAWGNTHDGVSFRIEKMEWVTEDGGLGVERGGQARRKRMRVQFGGDGPADGASVCLSTGMMGAENGLEMTTSSVAVGA